MFVYERMAAVYLIGQGTVPAARNSDDMKKADGFEESVSFSLRIPLICYPSPLYLMYPTL